MTAPLHLDPRSSAWPDELRTIDAPPDELWLRGDPALLEAAPRVAIVGSRAPTPYGEAQALHFATSLAEAGVVIVSRLARGIDAERLHAAGIGEARPMAREDTEAGRALNRRVEIVCRGDE